MPEAIGTAIVTAIEAVAFGGEWVFTASQIAAIGQAATAVALSAYSVNQRKKAAAAARAAYNAGLRDRNITVRGTLGARELVLGKVRKGGHIAFIGTTGTDLEQLTMVVVMAAHSVAGFDTIYFDETPLTLDGDGYVQTAPYYQTRRLSGTASMTVTAGAGSVSLPHTPVSGSVVITLDLGSDNGSTQTTPTSVVGSTVNLSGWGSNAGTAKVHYQYDEGTSHARVRSMLGSSSQAAFADLVTQFPGDWTTNHRLRGCAYLVVELDYDPDAFPTGIPNVSAVMRGADTVEDPRTSTTGYTENPALLLRHYLLHPMGGRRTAAQLDAASFIAAANVCDTSVDYGDGATALYTAGIVASTEAAPRDICDELAEAMAGRWGYSGGVIRVRAGALASTGATITADWIAPGTVTIQPARARSELRNVLQGTFIDPDSNWQLVQFPRVEDAAAVSADGAELPGEVEFGAINRVGQAQQVAAVMLREDRQSLTVSIVCNMRAYPLQLFDVVAVTLERFGWSGKLFEVVHRAYTHGGGIALTLKETSASIYTFGTSFPTNDPAPNTNLPSPWDVATPGTVSVTSGTSTLLDGTTTTRTVATWPALADAGVNLGGYIELAYLDATQAAEFQVVRAETATSHTLYGLRSGYHYLFKARGVNGTGVRGNWSATTVHQVSGPRSPVTYRQASAPTGAFLQAGDLWFDTDDGNAPYRYSGSAWVSVQDGDIATAQATAASKIKTFVAASAPTAESTGDLWIDSANGNRVYRWNGSAWSLYQLGTLALDSQAATTVTLAEDDSVTVSRTRPSVGLFTPKRLEVLSTSWTNNTGGEVYAECTVDFGAAISSGTGSAYIRGAWGLSALNTSTDIDSDELQAMLDVTSGYGHHIRSGAIAVPDGSTVYAYAYAHISPTTGGTTVSINATFVTLKVVAIKR